jgi:hypothetical protein
MIPVSTEGFTLPIPVITWHEYAGFTGYFQVNLTNGMVLTEFAFETGPRRTSTIDETARATTWLVPIGIETGAPRPR